MEWNQRLRRLLDRDVALSKLSWHVLRLRNDPKLLMLQYTVSFGQALSEMSHRRLCVFRITGCKHTWCVTLFVCGIWMFACFLVLTRLSSVCSKVQRCKSGEFEAPSRRKECLCLSVFTLQTAGLYSMFPCHVLHAWWVQLPVTRDRNMQIDTRKIMKQATKSDDHFWAVSEASGKISIQLSGSLYLAGFMYFM